MEQKKSNKANLERQRGSTILIGLVCATSLTLMSFEYANFEMNQTDDLMSSHESKDIEWKMTDEIVIFKPAAPVEQPKTTHVETVVAEPEIDVVEEVEEKEEVEIDLNNIPEITGGFGQQEETTELVKMSPITEVLPVADVMPEFPGGTKEMYKFIYKHIDYPDLCLELGVQGKTYIQFTVWRDGTIRDITIGQTTHKLLGEEALRVVDLMPKWIPGKVNGKDVNVSFSLPVNFIIE